MSGSGYGRRLSERDRKRATKALATVADDLGCIAREHGAQSAMVRVWVDRRGVMSAACNLYTKSAEVFNGGTAAVEFRRELGM